MFANGGSRPPDLVLRLKCPRCGAEQLPRARFLLVIDEDNRTVHLSSSMILILPVSFPR
jgi:hypothetical protein